MSLMTKMRTKRGNIFVELALVLMPVLALLLAIIDFALPIFLRSTFTHAVREGVRYGITFQTMPGLSQTDSIKRVVQTNAAGFLNGSSGLSRIQVKYYSPVTFLEVTGPAANADGNVVEVSVTGYSWSMIAPVWRANTPISVGAVSSDRLEVLPRTAARPTP